ncbi:MAG TPA: hypothetical protein VN260_04195 [Dissulfurispiraceae bacterium]|nr:hypothetical protein [Dissulfurispiraceae bacterium]
MAQRFINVLRGLARELIEKGYDAEDVVRQISFIDIDFLTIKEELMKLEVSNNIEEAELDTIRALLAYILLKETELEIEDIYAFVFGRGRQITWN